MRPGRRELAGGADLLDQVHDAIVVADLTGKIVTWNRSAERLYGYTREEAAGRAIETLYSPEDSALLKAAIRGPLKRSGLHEVELRARRKDGSARDVHVRLSLLRSKSGKVTGMAACSHDITAQKNSHEELKRSRARLEQEIEARTQALKAACAELRESEHNRRIVLASSPGVVYACSAHPPFETTFVGDNIARVFGYEPARFLTSADLWVNHIHPEDRKKVDAFSETTLTSGEGTIEYRFANANGEYRWVRDSIAKIQDESGNRIGFAGYVEDITEWVKNEEQRRTAERLRIGAETLVSTQEAERTRIARELHDDLMQRVSAFGLELAALDKHAAGVRPLRSRLRALRSELTEFSDDLQAIAYELHPGAFYRKGLRSSLEQECAFHRRRTGLAVKLDFDPACQAVHIDIATCLYRIVQEALRNITQHSGAMKASISVKRIKNDIMLKIEDSGKGFDLNRTGSKRGLGIVSMSERAHLLNGTFQIESRPGAGTRIRAMIPIREK